MLRSVLAPACATIATLGCSALFAPNPAASGTGVTGTNQLNAAAAALPTRVEVDDDGVEDLAEIDFSPRRTSRLLEATKKGEVLRLQSTPNTRMQPGDWYPPDALLVSYVSSWEETLNELLAAVPPDMPVLVLVTGEDEADPDFERWYEAHTPFVLQIEHDTPWVRDYGPMTIFENSETRWMDMEYSSERPLDDRVPGELARSFEIDVEPHPIELSGGALVSNGQGHCAITDVSLEDLNLDLESEDNWTDFLDTLGCEGLSILPNLPEEETGHADVFVQFLSPEVVALAEAVDDPVVAGILKEARETLAATAKELGQKLQFVRLPMPREGARYYTYTNSLRISDQLLVPRYESFRGTIEQTVRSRLHAALPGVRLRFIASDPMIELGGALHCMGLGLLLPNHG